LLDQQFPMFRLPTVRQVPLIQCHSAISQTWILRNSILRYPNLIFFTLHHFIDFILAWIFHLFQVVISKV
jgi:hypothetical protein